MATHRHLLLLAALLAAPLPSQDPPPPAANYVVHEWGTFTNMVGRNGLVLDGLHHEEEHLPKFVHDLMRIEQFATTTGEKMRASRVTQKMETPVIYFYSDAPQQVSVRVWFDKGLMTQFYPLPDNIWPPLATARQQRIDMVKVLGSQLHWNIDVLPRNGADRPAVPEVPADDPWSFARQTEACLVRTVPGTGSPARSEAEHYLFYRGLGRWQPAVTIAAEPAGRATLQNAMPQALPFTLLLELGERGGRFAVGGGLAAGAAHAFDLGEVPWQSDRAEVSKRVGAAVLQALVAQGLFLDEARAMVATWSRSWFQKDGTRVLYLLPGEQIDAVLPLELTPKPKQLVRVMVGRLEFITPEAQQRVEQALQDEASANPAGRARGAATLAGLDRFLEPHLRNVAEHGSSAGVRAAAVTRLAALTAGK